MNKDQLDQWKGLCDDEFVRFFRSKKTEMSCLEEPLIFLNKLRDCYLVPENLYQKVKKAKTKKTTQKYMYEILDWVEKECWLYIKLFWNCVFEDHILQQYPLFRLYRTSLLSVNKKTQQKKAGMKRKLNDDEAEESKPGPSSGSSIVPRSKAKPAKQLRIVDGMAKK